MNQPFTGALPFNLIVADPSPLAIQLGTPSVSLGGTLGSVTNGILKIAGIDINGRIKAALDRAISTEMLQKSIPVEYSQLNPTITTAKLFDNNGTLAASVEMTARVSGAALTPLLQAIATKPKS